MASITFEIPDDRAFSYGGEGSKSGVNVEFLLSTVAPETFIRGFEKAARHVFGNELASKALLLEKKADINDEQRKALIQEAADNFVKAMQNGTWGAGGVRGPRVTADQSFEDVYASVLRSHVMTQIRKYKLVAVEGVEDTYTLPNGQNATLAQLSDQYVNNPQMNAETGTTEGERRRAVVKAEAERKYNDLQEKKAAREAAAKVQANGEAFAF